MSAPKTSEGWGKITKNPVKLRRTTNNLPDDLCYIGSRSMEPFSSGLFWVFVQEANLASRVIGEIYLEYYPDSNYWLITTCGYDVNFSNDLCPQLIALLPPDQVAAIAAARILHSRG